MNDLSSAAVPKSGLYTRTGDKGQSALYSGERRAKTDPIFAALGDVDELNSSVGIAHHYCQKAKNGLDEQLHEIQCCLLEIGGNIATPRTKTNSEFKVSKTSFDDDASKVALLETWIDALDAKLPPLKNFILPGGGESAIFLHQCRAVCRRAERSIVPLVETEDADKAVGAYMNRLSDYFFAAARVASQFDGIEENVFVSKRIVKRGL
ncbi:cob(I)alamin adenosyltransferase [Paraphysoderma sedebokerense]|nr:cob(I)alamin adenosyltransferase [Paraphysoderma sedebokerense]